MKYICILFSLFILFLLTIVTVNSIRFKKYDATVNKIIKIYEDDSDGEYYRYREDVEILIPQINNNKTFMMTIKRKEENKLPNKKDIIKVRKHWLLGWTEETTFSEYLVFI